MSKKLMLIILFTFLIFIGCGKKKKKPSLSKKVKPMEAELKGKKGELKPSITIKVGRIPYVAPVQMVKQHEGIFKLLREKTEGRNFYNRL